MKYLVIDVTDGMDTFVTEFETVEEAIEFADGDFEHLTAHDRKHRKEYYILESVNPDEDSDDHFDGNVIKDYLAERGK